MTKKEINQEVRTERTANGYFHSIRVEDMLYAVNIDMFNPSQDRIYIENEIGEVFEVVGTTKQNFVNFIYELING